MTNIIAGAILATGTIVLVVWLLSRCGAPRRADESDRQQFVFVGNAWSGGVVANPDYPNAYRGPW